MESAPTNIFASISQEPTSKLQSITDQLQEIAHSVINKICEYSSSLSQSLQTNEKWSQNIYKGKQLLKQNKQIILGVSVVGLIYIINRQRTQNYKKIKSKHIHNLTSNPSGSKKRSGSKKKEGENLDQRQNQTNPSSSRKSYRKLLYFKAFISQEDEEYINSEQEDKDNPDLSTSTRRTDSMVSDIEPAKRKKKTSLQPILDLVEEEDQTQDRVFFQMFRTYRQS